jgi:AcrR family transcriptional regulator
VTAVDGLRTLVPEGADLPADVPPEIFRAALATVLARRRLDMRALALETGMARATLYRKVGDRDRLLGEVLWYLTRREWIRALEGSQSTEGAPRVVEVLRRFMHRVEEGPALRRLLEEEPEATLRILTSKHGSLQGRIIQTVERLLAQEEERGTLRPFIDRPTLAYVIVRIGESFLYADVIADGEPDVDRAVEIIARLLREG